MIIFFKFFYHHCRGLVKKRERTFHDLRSASSSLKKYSGFPGGLDYSDVSMVKSNPGVNAFILIRDKPGNFNKEDRK